MTPARPARLTAALLLATFVLPLVGGDCSARKKEEKWPLPTVEMRLGGKTFTLEVADTDATRQYGLMRRDSMPADHGMIFVFPEERPLGFYMKNTRIPLDIIYVTASGKVDSVKQMQPYDERTTPSEGNAQYAIELNKGTAASLGIKSGMMLELPPGLKSKD